MLVLLRRWWHDTMGALARQRQQLAQLALASPEVRMRRGGGVALGLGPVVMEGWFRCLVSGGDLALTSPDCVCGAGRGSPPIGTYPTSELQLRTATATCTPVLQRLSMPLHPRGWHVHICPALHHRTHSHMLCLHTPFTPTSISTSISLHIVTYHIRFHPATTNTPTCSPMPTSVRPPFRTAGTPNCTHLISVLPHPHPHAPAAGLL